MLYISKVYFFNVKSATFHLIASLQILKKVVVFHNFVVKIFLPNLIHSLQRYEVSEQLSLRIIPLRYHKYAVNFVCSSPPPFVKVEQMGTSTFALISLMTFYKSIFIMFCCLYFLHSVPITPPLVLVCFYSSI